MLDGDVEITQEKIRDKYIYMYNSIRRTNAITETIVVQVRGGIELPKLAKSTPNWKLGANYITLHSIPLFHSVHNIFHAYIIPGCEF